ncbi:MAG: ATP-grasp domain-containing protein [Peptococcaceae bacterium]|nr:ATP-grasp domain-containing protein [Peptococcaceae bacterium]
MKLFIFEYFASGMKESHELKKAGYAMLDAVLRDFTRIPEINIMTIFDYSLKERVFQDPLAPGLEIFWRKGREDGQKLFEEILIRCEAVLIIAPETAGILAELTALAENRGKIVLGSCSKALNVTCHKAKLLSLMGKKGLPVPRSDILQKPLASVAKAQILEMFSYPLVIKPVCGTGGEGVRLIQTGEQLDKVVEQLATMGEETFLVQEYIPGQAVSVSLFVLEGKVLPLSLNRQILKDEDELGFRGITVPYEHSLDQDIIKIASAACEQVEGLKGFIGVDLVAGPEGPVLIEINSRITLAYVALREVVSRNLAGDLLNLCVENRVPPKPEIQGRYTYRL